MSRKIVGTTLTGKHHMAITRLAKGKSATDVAKELHVDVSTIYSWQKWPLFQERLAQYIDSIAKQELDRGIEDAQVVLSESMAEIVMWMTGVVTGKIELKDPKRWRMALDLLHHAGILDKQALAKSEMPIPSTTIQVNQTNDQRRQAVLASGNQDIQDQLARFRPPVVQIP